MTGCSFEQRLRSWSQTVPETCARAFCLGDESQVCSLIGRVAPGSEAGECACSDLLWKLWISISRAGALVAGQRFPKGTPALGSHLQHDPSMSTSGSVQGLYCRLVTTDLSFISLNEQLNDQGCSPQGGGRSPLPFIWRPSGRRRLPSERLCVDEQVFSRIRITCQSLAVLKRHESGFPRARLHALPQDIPGDVPAAQ